MATSALKVLYNGQLAASDGSLATVTTDKTWLIKTITCHNTSTSTTETVKLTLTPGSTARVIGYAVLAPKETLIVTDIFAESGDDIRGSTTTATTVDVTIMGWEVTP